MKGTEASGQLFSVLLYFGRYHIAKSAQGLDFQLFLTVVVLVFEDIEQIDQVRIYPTGFYSRLQLFLLIDDCCVVVTTGNLQKHSHLVHQFRLICIIVAIILNVVLFILDYMTANIIKYLIVGRHIRKVMLVLFHSAVDEGRGVVRKHYYFGTDSVQLPHHL
jgi:hypothetical protein